MQKFVIFPMRHLWLLAVAVLLEVPPNAFAFSPQTTVTTSFSVLRLADFSRHSKPSSSRTRLVLKQSQQEKEELVPGTARFSRIETSQGGTSADGLTNALDLALSVFSSDIVSIGLGAIGLAVVVGHRLSTTFAISDTVLDTQALAQQTRTDLLAVFACGSVLLNGITKMDVVSALSESVVLQGVRLDKPEIDATLLDEDAATSNTVRWALESLLAATPAQSAVILQKSEEDGNVGWIVSARAGILPSQTSPVPESTPILDRVGAVDRNPNGKETYLPTLQNLPGRFEFTYLPSNTQLVLILPLMSRDSVLVLGSNTAKSFSPRDVAWSRVVVAELVDSQKRKKKME